MSERKAGRDSSAAETAWAVQQLCLAGIASRSASWCIGELRPHEIEFGEHGAVRTTGVTRYGRYRAHRHRRRGHDAWCEAIGVPRVTVQRVLRAMTSPDAAALIEDAICVAVREIESERSWSPSVASELVSYLVCTRITPQQPSSLQKETRAAVV